MSDLFVDAREKVGSRLADETYQSFPILLAPARGGPPLVAFLYGTLRAAREGRYYYAPHLLVRLDARSGEVVDRRRVTPAELGGPHQPEEVIGLHEVKRGRSVAEYTSGRDRLFTLYDRAALRFLDGAD